MSSGEEELRSLVESGDVDACVAWFEGKPEAERRALWASLRKTLSGRWWERGPCEPVVAFCIGPLSELQRIPMYLLPHGDLAIRLLLDRDPPWLEQWVAHILGQDFYWGQWTLVRRLLREGRIERPSTPRYVLSMIGGIGAPVIDALRADPALLDDEIWDLFAYEGGGENSLANVDRWGKEGWADALAELSREGRIDRQRLLDASLSALQRDFNHYRARWFTRFFDGLEPSPDEMEVRAEQFLGLLRMSAPPVVSWALAKVDKLARTGAYEPAILAVALEPVLSARAKGAVKKALKLLARLAKQPSQHAAVARTAIRALGHEAVDVQEQALDLLESVGDPHGLAAELEPYRELVAPTLRARLEAWTGLAPEDQASVALPDASGLPARLREAYAVDALLEQPAPDGWALPAARLEDLDLPRLSERAALQPVATLEELLDLCARALEDTLTPDDVERALDGIARLGGERPEDFDRRVGPVAKRARKVLERLTPFVGDGPPADLAGIVVAWLTSDEPTLRVEQRKHHEYAIVELAGQELTQFGDRIFKTIGFLSRRALCVAQQAAAGVTQPLLAAPTHEGGFIDPRILAERVTAWSGSDPSVTDVVLAMLRLAPEHRPEALATLAGDGPEWVRAIRYALGGSEAVGADPALWISAARARAPWRDDPAISERFPEAGPDAGTVADFGTLEPVGTYGVRLTGARPAARAHVSRDCPPQLFHLERGAHMWELGGIGGGTENSIRWVATLWPGARESLFAASAVAIASNLDWWEARWYSKALLEPLLEPATPLREMGLLLLAVGLGAKEPGEHLLAVDAAIAAIEDGRLGSDNLGAVLGDVLTQPFVKLGRYAKTLASVADASEGHAAVVLLALDAALPAVLRAKPRDHGKLVELLEQLCARLDAGVQPSTHDTLSALKGSSKAAKAARRIRPRSSESSDRMVAATRDLTAMRIAAASRWDATE